tara:strand:- start:257 stop:415 length:159 start_codon:yes stop_codon:yes gene_type:complete
MTSDKESKKQEKSSAKYIKGKKWDGISRLPNELYKKNWNKIFAKEEKKDDEQ